MKRLLIIAHAPSDNTQKMRQAVINGASDSEIENVEVVSLSPLETQPEHINSANAIILGTTENLGYMAGLMKDVFDRCYYPCLEKNEGLPFAFYVRAGHDGTGTRRAIEGITSGMRWRLVQDPLICKGDFQAAFLDQCEELGMSMAASLEAGII
ncbi:MAG: flavodoxin family protein [Halomonas sp.]|nr:flavodoxin family protein [Halomonas sp.]MBR2514993.1 flavodoxin family protein [Halomonas sp.]